jgi:hypothetical protein
MPTLRRDLASVQYWREGPERAAQRFYIAFCLLMSSAQDSVLGLKERAQSNHNWSATCSYYSMVHAGRLLCFLALGDYPMQHARLRDVFSREPVRGGNRGARDRGYPFDWLASFTGRPGLPRRPATCDAAIHIAGYLGEIGVSQVASRLDYFGTVLVAAAALRNDSNYEALLIAHEFRHASVSDAFDDLSRYMAAGAAFALDLVIDAFTAFRHHDLDLPEGRPAREAFLNEYVHDRIGGAIRAKIAFEPSAEARLREVLDRIQTCTAYAPYQVLDDHVSRTLFEGKANLITGFEERVRELGRRITGNGPQFT